MDEMQAQIDKAIAESLPSAVGSVLQSELKRLKEIEGKYSSSQKELESCRASVEKKQKELIDTRAELNDLKSIVGLYQKRDSELREKEINCSVHALNAELDAQKRINENTLRLVETIFRNPATKKTIQTISNENIPTTGANGYPGMMTQTANSTVTETIGEV
jgi:DNA repair exonuclease SbcCD ATPase subunit